jgi:hypothetical protein
MLQYILNDNAFNKLDDDVGAALSSVTTIKQTTTTTTTTTTRRKPLSTTSILRASRRSTPTDVILTASTSKQVCATAGIEFNRPEVQVCAGTVENGFPPGVPAALPVYKIGDGGRNDDNHFRPTSCRVPRRKQLEPNIAQSFVVSRRDVMTSCVTSVAATPTSPPSVNRTRRSFLGRRPMHFRLTVNPLPPRQVLEAVIPTRSRTAPKQWREKATRPIRKSAQRWRPTTGSRRRMTPIRPIIRHVRRLDFRLAAPQLDVIDWV